MKDFVWGYLTIFAPMITLGIYSMIEAIIAGDDVARCDRELEALQQIQAAYRVAADTPEALAVLVKRWEDYRATDWRYTRAQAVVGEV